MEGLILVIARYQEDKITTYPVQLKKLILGKIKLGKSDHGLDKKINQLFGKDYPK